jgi:hypothetical protein
VLILLYIDQNEFFNKILSISENSQNLRRKETKYEKIQPSENFQIEKHKGLSLTPVSRGSNFKDGLSGPSHRFPTKHLDPNFGENNELPNFHINKNIINTKNENDKEFWDRSDMFPSGLTDPFYKVDRVYANTKKLIRMVEEVYLSLELPKLIKHRLYNHLMKSLKSYLVKDFNNYLPQFQMLSTTEKVQIFSNFVTQYAVKLFGRELDWQFNQSIHGGEWGGVEFVLGSFISRETMKQMITSSREKAYFYSFQKLFKITSQKKLAVILKNNHFIHLIQYLFESEKIRDVLKSF